MSQPSKIMDHVDQALARLPQAFDEASNHRSVIEIHAERIQTLEAVFYDLLVARYLGTAVGAQLDQWGGVVSELRSIGGLDDESYLRFIRAHIAVRNTNHTAEDILNVVILLTGATHARVFDLNPCGISVEYEVPVPLSVDVRRRIVELIRSATGPGVQLKVVEYGPESFGFDEAVGTLGFGVGRYGTRVDDG